MKNDLLTMANPARWLPFLLPSAQAQSTDCFSQFWLRSLWWMIQLRKWNAAFEHIHIVEAQWPFEASRALIFILAIANESDIKMDVNEVTVGGEKLHLDAIIHSWKRVLIGCRDQLFLDYDHPRSWGLVATLQCFSERFVSVLPSVQSWENLEKELGWDSRNHGTPLVHLCPYQKSPKTQSEWVAMDNQSSIPIWKILDIRAHCGDMSAARLLAEGYEAQHGGMFGHPPVRTRLYWLSRIPFDGRRIPLFQRLLIDYWEGDDADQSVVIDVCEQVGVDTILGWMEGWVNPLFIAQNGERGHTLARLSMDVSTHFQRQTLLLKWMNVLWSWINDSPVDGRFVRWKGRRVPLRLELDVFLEIIFKILSFGIHQLQGVVFSRLVFQTPSPSESEYSYAWWIRIWRMAKEALLVHRDDMIIQQWYQDSPKIDLDVERAILQDEQLLSLLWQKDSLGQRRSELLRLAGLVTEMPYWAVVEATRLVQQEQYWPKWLSPYASETTTLVALMCSGDDIQDRLWWWRVHYHHHLNPQPIFSQCVEALSTEFYLWSTQFVSELNPNKTPRLDGGDLLAFIHQIQKNHPNQWMQASKMRATFRTVWRDRWFKLSEDHIVRFLMVLRLDSPQEKYIELDQITEFWSELTPSVQRLLLDDWKHLEPVESLKGLMEHPLVGQWALVKLLENEDPMAIEYLELHLKAGRFEVLRTALLHDIPIQQIIDWLSVWTRDNPEDAPIMIRRCISEGLGKLRTDSIWQQWIRHFL